MHLCFDVILRHYPSKYDANALKLFDALNKVLSRVIDFHWNLIYLSAQCILNLGIVLTTLPFNDMTWREGVIMKNSSPLHENTTPLTSVAPLLFAWMPLIFVHSYMGKMQQEEVVSPALPWQSNRHKLECSSFKFLSREYESERNGFSTS